MRKKMGKHARSRTNGSPLSPQETHRRSYSANTTLPSLPNRIFPQENVSPLNSFSQVFKYKT